MQGLPAALGCVACLCLTIGAIAVAVILLRGLKPREGTIDGARPAPPPKVAAGVLAVLDRLADRATADAAADELTARGADVVPDLVAALARRDAPWRRRVIDVLGRIGDRRARPVLEGIVIRSEPEEREAVAAVASMGTEEVVETLLAVLRLTDPPDPPAGWIPLRCRVYVGIVAAAARGRVTPEFRDALAAPLAARIGERPYSAGAGAADALVALDRGAARHVLLSPEILGRGPNAVAESLTALFDAGVVVDAALAKSLADDIPLRPAETEADVARLAAVLRTLARSGHPDARARIDAFAALPHEHTHRIAVDARCVLAGIDDADGYVAARLAEVGFDRLAPAQRTWRLTRRYVTSVGHAAWFAGGGADRAAETVAALREIGAGDAADVLAETCRRFGIGTPADSAERRGRPALVVGAYASPVGDLDERLWDAAGAAQDRLAEFAVAHAEDFRRGPPGAPPGPPSPPSPQRNDLA